MESLNVIVTSPAVLRVKHTLPSPSVVIPSMAGETAAPPQLLLHVPSVTLIFCSALAATAVKVCEYVSVTSS